MIACVVGERDGAVFALHRLAAGAAEHDGGVSAAVEQDHSLFAAREALANGLCEATGKEHLLFFILLLELGAHVEDLDLRQRALLDAFAQLDELVLAALSIMVGLERRRSRAKDHGSIRQL